MPRARRLSHAPTVELMPLIDVVFLLLTFFIFALVLTVPLRVTQVNLPNAAAGERGEATGRVAVLAMSPEGALTLDDASITLEALPQALVDVEEEFPGYTLLLAVDEGATVGDQFQLIDALQAIGVERLSFLREPEQLASTPAGPPVPGQ